MAKQRVTASSDKWLLKTDQYLVSGEFFRDYGHLSPYAMKKLREMDFRQISYSGCNFEFTSGTARDMCRLIAAHIEESRLPKNIRWMNIPGGFHAKKKR